MNPVPNQRLVHLLFTAIGQFTDMTRPARHLTVKIDEAAQMRSVEQALLRKFEGRLDRETICAEVRRRKASFADARIRSFVPVLVQRAVTDALRRR